MIQYQSKKCRSQQSKIKPVKISQYDLPRQHVLVNTSQLCETLSPVDPNGNNFPQIASPPLPPWNLRIWRVFVVSPHEKPSCSSTTIGLGRTCDPYQLWTVHRHQHQPYSRCWRSCRVKSHLRHDTPVRYDAVPCHWTDPVRKAKSSSFWVKLDGISLPPSRRMFSLLSLSKIWKFHLSHQLHSKV